MLTFTDIREKAQLIGSGEKPLKSYKAGKKKNVDVLITQKGGKFGVYINKDKLDDRFKSLKDAEKEAADFIKLMGEELEL